MATTEHRDGNGGSIETHCIRQWQLKTLYSIPVSGHADFADSDDVPAILNGDEAAVNKKLSNEKNYAVCVFENDGSKPIKCKVLLTKMEVYTSNDKSVKRVLFRLNDVSA